MQQPMVVEVSTQGRQGTKSSPLKKYGPLQVVKLTSDQHMCTASSQASAIVHFQPQAADQAMPGTSHQRLERDQHVSVTCRFHFCHVFSSLLSAKLCQ